MRTSTILFLLALIWPISGHAETIRQMNDPSIMISTLMQAFNSDIDDAIAIIDKIDNPDTQSITVRAIGMVLAIHRDYTDEQYRDIFKKLDDKVLIISDEGARDIAYTYIAMAQAFAGLDSDATKTTDSMQNPALKHKAFGETAEIQAERGDYDAAMTSINLINSTAFKNKALKIVSDIFVKRHELNQAYKAAMKITNPTKKASSLQKIINAKIGLNEVDK